MKRKLIILIILIPILFIIGIHFYTKNFTNNINKINEENNKTIFSVDKITFFSSANAEIEISNETKFNNLTQYTDIAIFINNKNSSEIYTEENTLKELYISNIQFNTLPTLGQPNLFYKNLNDFATNKYNSENMIRDNLSFSISDKEDIDYSLPILYNNCANPITLCYVNSNILDTYSIANNTNSFYYDGTLLKNCNVLLSSINCNFSFDIYIVNNLNQKFKTTINIDVPLQDESSSLYQGNIILEDNVNFVFEYFD